MSIRPSTNLAILVADGTLRCIGTAQRGSVVT
jgi:hypothetical protein